MSRRSDAEDKKQKEYKAILEGLLKLPENKVCADCGAAAPRWASATLGVFICMRCAGIHRSMGTHISFVRSVTLDVWNETQVGTMQTYGNARAAAIYEGKVPKHCPRPNNGDNIALDKWIRDKYEVKRFYKAPTEETFQPPAAANGNGKTVTNVKSSNGYSNGHTNSEFGFESIRAQPKPIPTQQSTQPPNLFDPTPINPPQTHVQQQQLRQPQQPTQQVPQQVQQQAPQQAPQPAQVNNQARQGILSLFDQGSHQPQYSNHYYGQPGQPNARYYQNHVQHPHANGYTHNHMHYQQPNHQQQLHPQQQQNSQLLQQQLLHQQQVLQHQQQLLHQQQLQLQQSQQGHHYATGVPNAGVYHHQNQNHTPHAGDDLLLKINNMGQERRKQEFAVFNS